jgi:hypothetical protein
MWGLRYSTRRWLVDVLREDCWLRFDSIILSRLWDAAVDRIRRTTLAALSKASTAMSLLGSRRLEDHRDEGAVDEGNYFWSREMRWR